MFAEARKTAETAIRDGFAAMYVLRSLHVSTIIDIP